MNDYNPGLDIPDGSLTKAYTEGWRAYERGEAVSSNPYPVSERMESFFMCWTRGWVAKQGYSMKKVFADKRGKVSRGG